MKLYIPMVTLSFKKKEITLVTEDAQPNPPKAPAKPKRKFAPRFQLWEKRND